jgi:Family of unknown function (DUF6263)
MNKNIFLIMAVLASGLVWAGCNKAGKLSQTSKFIPPAGPVELQPKWPVGEQVVQSYDMKMNSEISVPGQPNPIIQDSVMGQKYRLTVLKAEADGGRELEMEFLAMRLKVEQGGKTVLDYDSDKKATTGRKNASVAAIEKIFKNIVGTKIQYYLDASNHVVRIEGVDQLTSRLATGGAPEATAGIKNMFGEDYLKQMMDRSRYFPPNPVQPGDGWPVQMDLPMGNLGSLVMDYHYTFQNWEKRGPRMCARLEFDGTLKSKPGENPAAGGVSMKIQDGSTAGASWFDPELGMIIDSTANQNLTLVMSMPINVRGKTVTQTMTNLMHQTITTKVESVK